jgi:rhodanese-related sulfurtransferase
MRKVFVVAVAVALALTGSMAQAQMKQKATPRSAPLVVPNAQTATNGFRRISQADAFRLYKEGKAVFIDVRSHGQFTLGHIKGAHTIPGSQILKRLNEVPVRKTIITYCACTAEQSSGRAATELMNHGVKDVFALKGGWSEWKASGYPFAAGPK